MLFVMYEHLTLWTRTKLPNKFSFVCIPRLNYDSENNCKNTRVYIYLPSDAKSYA